MIKSVIRFLASVVTAICAVAALYCPWGFLFAFEPRQEAFRYILPVVFVVAIGLGSLAYRVARRS